MKGLKNCHHLWKNVKKLSRVFKYVKQMTKQSRFSKKYLCQTVRVMLAEVMTRPENSRLSSDLELLARRGCRCLQFCVTLLFAIIVRGECGSGGLRLILPCGVTAPLHSRYSRHSGVAAPLALRGYGSCGGAGSVGFGCPGVCGMAGLLGAHRARRAFMFRPSPSSWLQMLGAGATPGMA